MLVIMDLVLDLTTLEIMTKNDFTGANFKDIKLEVPTFDGQLDPQIFLDWISDMDHYFDWYYMSDERRVRFAKMKLVGQARKYWTNVEKLVRLRHQEAIQTWDEIKQNLQEKCLCNTNNVYLTSDNV